jgi:bacterioferritin
MDGGPLLQTPLTLQTPLSRASFAARGVDYAAFQGTGRSRIMSEPLSNTETEQVIATLNRILELELAGLVRYMHYSFMIFGHNRIPIVGWLRDQAEESKTHATQAGEHITNLGGHPSLKIGSLLETHKHNVDEILAEALAHEEEGLDEYRKLLKQVADKSIMLEEYARAQIAAEEQHLAEIRKMMRRPGSIK